MSSGVFSYKGTNPNRSESILMSSFNLNCLLSPIQSRWGLGLCREFGGGDAIQFIAAFAQLCACSRCTYCRGGLGIVPGCPHAHWGWGVFPIELSSSPWQAGPGGAIGLLLPQRYRATCPVETGPAIYPMDTMRTRVQATG